ncbi:hypothetical protein CCACVL1_21366 [Corchorus capsularis]|uniref:Uncharacterized protein n=1 Tax=Corchorus capsularis TaxID=210143 RepID=A0A1R3H698_COCAP|nr:hypothetical protein CCACVL1_21366 [Corchorus capsularis]
MAEEDNLNIRIRLLHALAQMRIAPRKHFMSLSSCRLRLQVIESMKEVAKRLNFLGEDEEVLAHAIVLYDRYIGVRGVLAHKI